MSINRRKFLGLTSVTGSALLLSSLDSLAAAPVSLAGSNKNYELLILATNWGFSGNYDEFCARIKKEGYNGMEVWVPGDDKGRTELADAVKKHQVSLGLLCGGNDRDPQKHLIQFNEALMAGT